MRQASWVVVGAALFAACSHSADHAAGNGDAGRSHAGTVDDDDAGRRDAGSAPDNGGAGSMSQSTAGRSAAANGGGSAAGSSGSASVNDGQCDPGTTTTTWASSCPTTSAYTCTAGIWTAAGSNTNDPLVLESAHFAIYAPDGTVTDTQAQAALDVLETTIWPAFMGAPIFFPEPHCNTANKHKVSIVIHSDYGLTGGGWGNGELGMWIGPGATSDHWGLAHEFTHALQTATGGLANSQYTGWIWESHANWHAHQLPEYHHENVHCSEMLPNFPHLYLGSTRDRYCNWQFMEYLKDKYCYRAVDEMWTKAPKSGAAQSGADPFSVIQSNMGWSVAQLNDFFGEWAMHNVTWDYRDPDGNDEGALYRKSYGAISDVTTSAPGNPPGFRRLRLTRLDPLGTDQARYVTPTQWAPQRWGYNVVRLYPAANADHVNVKFRGVLQTKAAMPNFGSYKNQPSSIPSPDPDWRWGLVAVDASGTHPRYSALQHGSDAELNFCIDAQAAQLYLVVVATPSTIQKIEWDQMYYAIYRYPWMVELESAQPDGFQPNAPDPSMNGHRSKAGGWIANNAKVDDTVYVGPYAQVLGGTVSGQVRVDEHAIVLSGSVSGSATIKGMSVLSGLTVSDSAVLSTVFQPPGTFESGQHVSGNAQLWGDIELRDQGIDVSKGVFYGFVDTTASTDAMQGADRNAPSPEVTLAPPYVWRP